MDVHIGTSGWSYPHWEGVLYPPDTPPHERLGYYLHHFRTVEINSTFYRWPADRSFASWQRRLPEGFLMAVKAPRGLTHGKRLYVPERWIQRVVSGLPHLGSRRGPLLVQLAPGFEYDYARLAFFLDVLPRWVQPVLEFRHPSWHREEVFELLASRGASYCVMSGAGLPCILRATAPLVYVRLHGPDDHYLYGGSYSDDSLRWWADRIREWAGSGHRVMAYFNNDGFGNAVRNAWQLRATLGI